MHLFPTNITAVDHVEPLEPDEGAKDKGKVIQLIRAVLIILVSGLSRVVVVEVKDRLSTVHNDNHDSYHVEHSQEDLTIHLGCHQFALW